ncbi:hypothetical protein C0J52_20366, partial [Blattella germanica]
CKYKGGGGLEAVFHIGGLVNRHNCHYWASANPHECVEKVQGLPKVTVWCGITSSQVLGSFFLCKTMYGERYLEMLQVHRNSLMCHFEGEYMKFCSKKLWLDMSTIGHTAHIPPKVNFLPYSLKHIGRHLLNCSGDTMSKLYGPFFFQEQTITGIIYLDMLQNISCWSSSSSKFLWFVLEKKKGTVELRHRIAAAVQQVTPDMLQRVWQEIDFRWDVCRMANGAHIEP